MSGYPSRRPVSPLGGYYDTREVRPSAYDRERDAANLNRYGTISGNTRPPVGHPSEPRHRDTSLLQHTHRPGDILGRSPPPRNTPFDELDMLDAAARRSSRRSPPQPPIPRRSSRRPRANPQPEEMLPADEILGTGSGSRRGQYPFGLYGGSRRYESHSYGSERRGPWNLALNTLLAAQNLSEQNGGCRYNSKRKAYQDRMPRSLASPTEGPREAKDLQVAPSSPSVIFSLRRQFMEKLLKHRKRRTDTSVPVSQVDGIKIDEGGKTTEYSQELERSLSYEDYLIHTRPRDVWLPLDPSVSPSDPASKAAVKASQS
ncbi:hypothetical protein BST61_g1184 [Cercospora zeina]